jgi:hypothetical protein
VHDKPRWQMKAGIGATLFREINMQLSACELASMELQHSSRMMLYAM